jgi:hypothetical protein
MATLFLEVGPHYVGNGTFLLEVRSRARFASMRRRDDGLGGDPLRVPFPQPWNAEKIAGGLVVRDANGQ